MKREIITISIVIMCLILIQAPYASALVTDCDEHCLLSWDATSSQITGFHGNITIYNSQWYNYPNSSSYPPYWCEMYVANSNNAVFVDIGGCYGGNGDIGVVTFVQEGYSWTFGLSGWMGWMYEEYGWAIGRDGYDWNIYLNTGEGWEEYTHYTFSTIWTGTSCGFNFHSYGHPEPSWALSTINDIQYQVSGNTWYNYAPGEAVGIHYYRGDCEFESGWNVDMSWTSGTLSIFSTDL